MVLCLYLSKLFLLSFNEGEEREVRREINPDCLFWSCYFHCFNKTSDFYKYHERKMYNYFDVAANIPIEASGNSILDFTISRIRFMI